MSSEDRKQFDARLDPLMKKVLDEVLRGDPIYFGKKLKVKDILPYLHSMYGTTKERVERTQDRDGDRRAMIQLIEEMQRYAGFAMDFLRALDKTEHRDMAEYLISGLDLTRLPYGEHRDYIKQLSGRLSPPPYDDEQGSIGNELMDDQHRKLAKWSNGPDELNSVSSMSNSDTGTTRSYGAGTAMTGSDIISSDTNGLRLNIVPSTSTRDDNFSQGAETTNIRGDNFSSDNLDESLTRAVAGGNPEPCRQIEQLQDIPIPSPDERGNSEFVLNNLGAIEGYGGARTASQSVSRDTEPACQSNTIREATNRYNEPRVGSKFEDENHPEQNHQYYFQTADPSSAVSDVHESEMCISKFGPNDPASETKPKEVQVEDANKTLVNLRSDGESERYNAIVPAAESIMNNETTEQPSSKDIESSKEVVENSSADIEHVIPSLTSGTLLYRESLMSGDCDAEPESQAPTKNSVDGAVAPLEDENRTISELTEAPDPNESFGPTTHPSVAFEASNAVTVKGNPRQHHMSEKVGKNIPSSVHNDTKWNLIVGGLALASLLTLYKR